MHFYESAMKPTSPIVSPPRGKEVHLCIFIDSNHTDDIQSRRSMTRLKMYMNISLINWCSKKQSTIETSVFSA